MRVGLLFAGVVAMSSVVIAGSASAKVVIDEATITGPGIEGRIRIEGRDTKVLWLSGISVVGGLDDARADSVGALGVSPGDRGPRYPVTYRFYGDFLVRQELYPYAKGGPVTYTPPGQEVTADGSMKIAAGWHESSSVFFRYLVNQGLPRENPVASVSNSDAARDAAPETRTAPWTGIVVVLVALAALSMTALAVRRLRSEERRARR